MYSYTPIKFSKEFYYLPVKTKKKSYTLDHNVHLGFNYL